eukprot:m.348150 g.348150  ORF g.348150 m.348150 type:complete len:67 (-) comp35700_c0_seq1:232-432(-)
MVNFGKITCQSRNTFCKASRAEALGIVINLDFMLNLAYVTNPNFIYPLASLVKFRNLKDCRSCPKE